MLTSIVSFSAVGLIEVVPEPSDKIDPETENSKRNGSNGRPKDDVRARRQGHVEREFSSADETEEIGVT